MESSTKGDWRKQYADIDDCCERVEAATRDVPAGQALAALSMAAAAISLDHNDDLVGFLACMTKTYAMVKLMKDTHSEEW